MSYANINEFSTYRGVSLQTGEVQEYQYTSRSLFKAGANTTGFRSIKWKKNTMVTNDYVVSGVTTVPGTNNLHVRILDNEGVIVQSDGTSPAFFPLLSADTDISARAESSAVSALNSKLKNCDFNVAQAFGERRQIVNMLANTAIRLTSGFRALKQGDLKTCIQQLGLSTKYVYARSGKAVNRFNSRRAKDAHGAAAGLWLELQYGWKPLISDVYSATKVIAENNVARGNDSFYTTQTISVSKSIDDSKEIITDTGEGADRVFSKAVHQIKYTSRLKMSYRVDNELLRYSSMLGITNPALLAWELTPFSFVVDWFLPIGKYLENSQASYGLTPVKGSSSLKFSGRSSGSGYTGDSSVLGQGFSETNGGYTESRVYTRSNMSSFPPEPLPSLKNPLSLGHALNSIALLTQVFKR